MSLAVENGSTLVKESPDKPSSINVCVFLCMFVCIACPVMGLHGQVFSLWAKQLLAC